MGRTLIFLIFHIESISSFVDSPSRAQHNLPLSMSAPGTVVHTTIRSWQSHCPCPVPASLYCQVVHVTHLMKLISGFPLV